VPDVPDGRRVEPLPLVTDLLRALDAADVVYCHWKSNEAIDRTLTAENDLDLLVARRDGTRFNTAVHALGFRIARPSPDRHVPGLVDYFGRDLGSGRMVHLQAHFQLVLGDDMTKNFRLPLEDAYLASRFLDGPVAVPNRAFELLIFTLRMVVKHCPWDAQLARQGRLTASERRELEFLEARSDADELEALRAEHLPFVPVELMAQCRGALEGDAGRVTRATVGRDLLRALEPFGRRPRRTDLRLRLWRRLWRGRQHGHPRSRRSLDSGGLFVGVVGGDGSGKSSAVAAAVETFARRVPTYGIHLGKPPGSTVTRLLGRSMRRLGIARGTRALPAWTDWETIGFPGHGFMLFHALTANDRRRTYRRARRAADSGAVVISDRFPLDGIELMDAPRTVRLPGLERRPVARWLAAFEARCYRAIDRPDLLVVLRVDPDLAVARRPEQDADFVRRRAAEVWAHDWGRGAAVVVDASLPHEDVIDRVHAAIWDAL
jgi:thymidylate kinase